MRQKIKVMKQKPEISDDEIRSYMDFDRLVTNVKVNTVKGRSSGLLKGIILPVAISGVLVWIIYFIDFRKEPLPLEGAKKSTVSGEARTIDDANVPTTKDIQTLAKKKESSSISSQVAEEKQTKKPLPSDANLGGDVYVQAEPVDGYAFLYEYFNNNLVYPPEAIKDSLQGLQTVSFQINAEGRPEKIQVKQSLGDPFEKEATRLIENMPLWKPATLNGLPVSSQISLPLTFQLKKSKTTE